MGNVRQGVGAIDEDVYHWFYRVERLGAGGLSDGGGPFGFDIIAALQVDHLIERYRCDAIVETGCHRGDTTMYLAQRYPGLALLSCDIDAELAAATAARLAGHGNVSIRHADSPEVVREAAGRFERPFHYLDAHGKGPWPLARELAAIGRGVVCIDDFDIGHPRYHYDTYDGVRCGPDVLVPFRDRVPYHYVVNTEGRYPFPCLQMGRRAGRGFFALGLGDAPFAESDYFVRRETPAA